MALIRCRECGQVISDQADRCPMCGCPTNRQIMPYQQVPNQMYQNREGNSNKVLYAVIGFLFATLVCCVILWFSMSKTDDDDQELAEQIENEDVWTTNKKSGQQTAQPHSVPVKTAKETYVAPAKTILSGVLNGDAVTFELYSNGSSNVNGHFYNYTINVSFAVKGTLTNKALNLRSVNHGKWRFVATNYGGTFKGYAYNGSVTYDMTIQ